MTSVKSNGVHANTRSCAMKSEHEPFVRSSIHRKASVRTKRQRHKSQSDKESESNKSESENVKTENGVVTNGDVVKNPKNKDVGEEKKTGEGKKVKSRSPTRISKDELSAVSECQTFHFVTTKPSSDRLPGERPLSICLSYTDRTRRQPTSPNHAANSTSSSPRRPQSYVEISDATELTRSGDDDVDGLQTANVNGLSISRAQLMFMQKDESRAPKDDRRKVLESKLEDGQVNAEFEKIPRKVSTADCSIALMPENLFRNRFKDIHPYDSSRVRLKPKSDNPMGYINASHVRVRVKSQELWYLSAQGPLSDTIADFWQMVWEQDVQVIAMLTDIKELGKEKCAQYWPLSPGNKHRMTYGDFVVSLQFRNDSGCFVTSGLNLHNKAEAKDRMIWHLQFTDWPDHGCPDDVHGFLAYLEEIESVQRHIVMENQDMKALPILVHCSAGVGRTGVAILVEVMKTCLEFNQNVDVATVLATLRGQRMHMVQMVGQYTFVYKTLIQYLKNSRLI